MLSEDRKTLLFPKELIPKIICHLSGADRIKVLWGLQLACEHYYGTAQELLYKDVTLNSVKSAVELYRTLSRVDPKKSIILGDLVTSIRLINSGFGEEKWNQLYQKKFFTALFKMVPHLKEIHVEKPTPVFWAVLKDAQLDCPNIKSISEVEIEFAYGYMQTAKLYKEKLEKFAILRYAGNISPSTLSDYLRDPDELCKELSSFEQLTYLEFPFFCDNLSFLYFVPLLRVLPNLKYVKISIDNSRIQLRPSHISNLVDLPLPEPWENRSITDLDLVTSFHNEDIVEYVMENFFVLEVFKIEGRDKTNIDFSTDTLSKLVFEFRLQLKELYFEQSIGNTLEVARKLEEEALLRNVKFSVTFDHRSIRDSIIVDEEDEDEYKDENRADINSYFTVSQKENGPLELMFDQMEMFEDDPLPEVKILRILGQSLVSVRFVRTLISKNREKKDDDDDVLSLEDYNKAVKDLEDGKHLDFVFSPECPGLTTLELENGEIVEWIRKGDSKASSLINLKISKYTIPSDFLHNISLCVVNTLGVLKIGNVTIVEKTKSGIINIDMSSVNVKLFQLGSLMLASSSGGKEMYYLKISTQKGDEYRSASLNREKHDFKILTEKEYLESLEKDTVGVRGWRCQIIHVKLNSFEELRWKPSDKKGYSN